MRVCASAVARCASLIAVVLSFTGSVAIAQTLPSPWSATDIGDPTIPGGATEAGGVFTIEAAGADISKQSDQFHFVYQRVSGNVEILARLDSLEAPGVWAKGGLMIRGSLTDDSAHAYVFGTEDHGVHFNSRESTGAVMATLGTAQAHAPVWLRIVRAGSQVTASYSTTGTTWTTVGTRSVTLDAPVFVGMAVSSPNTKTLANAVFSNVRVSQAGQSGSPSGPQSTDIGNPAIPGSTAYESGRYTISAGGADIWDTSDQFRFVYQPLSGNGEVIARVASLVYTDTWAKAGVMIRESLSANSKNAMVAVTPGQGYVFQRRPETGGYSEYTPGGSGTAPSWVRVVRSGDLFEAYRSTDGTTWTRIGSDTIPMGETVYAGIAVTSHNAALATTAVVENFKVNTGAAGNQAPAVSITSPVSGAQFGVPSTVTIAATATDPEGRMASVDFYAGSTLIARESTSPYSVSWSISTAGTYALTAVAHDADGGSSTSAAVSVTGQSGDDLPTTTAPRAVSFTASSNHGTAVTKYVLEIFAAGANVLTAVPVATSDLGKPTPSSTGEITVDRSSFFSALPVGSYLASITAVGPGGEAPSTPVSFTR